MVWVFRVKARRGGALGEAGPQSWGVGDARFGGREPRSDSPVGEFSQRPGSNIYLADGVLVARTVGAPTHLLQYIYSPRARPSPTGHLSP